MELRKKLLSVASLAFAAALSAGVAVSAGAENEAPSSFAITHVGVRTVGTQDAPNATGIRFLTTVGADAANTYAEAECYTTLSFTSSVESEGKNYSKDIAVQYWRADGKGWNTVLVGIPSSDYDTEITAKSYIKVSDTVVYETAEQTMSVAMAASKAMQNGETAEKLTEYTANAVESIVFDVTEKSVLVGDTFTLTATTAPTAGFGVVWASDDTSVATVDKNGKVTPVGVGTAKITATMSGQTATCTVTVGARTLYDFETEGQVMLADNFVNLAADGTEKITTWSIAEGVGADGNGVLQAKLAGTGSGMYWSMNTSYLNKVFETANYISFDVYTDVSSLQFVRLEGNSQQYIYGQSNLKSVDGQLAGEVNDKAIYKYNFAIPKARYLSAIDNSTEVLKINFNFTATVEFWAFDNFNVEGKYDGETIDFENGQQTGAILPEWNGSKDHLQVVEKEEGNYALKGVNTANWDSNFLMDVDYFIYVFHTLQAKALQFTVYRSGYVDTQSAAFRLSLNDDTNAGRTTTGITYAEDKANGKVTVTIARAAYEQWFENGVYKNNVDTVSSVTYIKVMTRLRNGNSDGVFYLDDFTIVVPEDCAAIDTTYLNEVNATSITEKTESVTLTNSGSTWAIGYDINFLMDAFYVQNATSVTMRLSVAEYDITGFRFASNQTYGRVILWTSTTAFTSLFNADDTSRWEIVDGDAILTLNAADFKAYFNADGTCKTAGGLTLGWRLCAQSGTTNIRGTFTISDITVNK